jgi:hypothetical protein
MRDDVATAIEARLAEAEKELNQYKRLLDEQVVATNVVTKELRACYAELGIFRHPSEPDRGPDAIERLREAGDETIINLIRTLAIAVDMLEGVEGAGVKDAPHRHARSDMFSKRPPGGRGEMLLTEKEAKDKWCSLVGGTPEEALCGGSKCMAWRWKGTQMENPDYPVGVGSPVVRTGYCGLAAKPDAT